MAFRQDFIMRQIEQLADAFFQVVAGGQASKEDLSILEEALSDVLNTRRQFLWSLSDETWELLDPSVAAEVARLWALHAVESGRKDSAKNAIDVARYALGIELRRSEETVAEHLYPRVREFGELGLDREVARSFLERLLDHFVEHENWEKVEDVLFDRLALGDSPALCEKATHVFEGLRARDDEYLEAAGMTRSDLASILAELSNPSS